MSTNKKEKVECHVIPHSELERVSLRLQKQFFEVIMNINYVREISGQKALTTVPLYLIESDKIKPKDVESALKKENNEPEDE